MLTKNKKKKDFLFGRVTSPNHRKRKTKGEMPFKDFFKTVSFLFLFLQNNYVFANRSEVECVRKNEGSKLRIVEPCVLC